MKKACTNVGDRRLRIYLQDRYTNEIWYFETKWPSISYDKLEKYLKENHKKFLYITNINYELKSKDKKKLTKH